MIEPIWGVECPNCESLISWRILYAGSREVQEQSLGKKHSTRCGLCGCVFEYLILRLEETKRPHWYSLTPTTTVSYKTENVHIINQGRNPSAV